MAEAPSALYRRAPSVLPEICDSLLVCIRHSFPQGVEISLKKLLTRSGLEARSEVRLELAGKLLRFSLDNTKFPVGAITAGAFADVYGVAIKSDKRPPSFFSALFGTYEWDRGKDLRISRIDAFQRSNWNPGDLAIAADKAGILSKVLKRLRGKAKGDAYINSMLQDLTHRGDPEVAKVRKQFMLLVNNPDFYEEWD